LMTGGPAIKKAQRGAGQAVTRFEFRHLSNGAIPGGYL
jgi:hypothetical protein